MPKMNLPLIFLIIIFISFITPVWAKTMYVTDSIKITFRHGPSIRHKVLAMLKSGEEVIRKAYESVRNVAYKLLEEFKSAFLDNPAIDYLNKKIWVSFDTQ